MATLFFRNQRLLVLAIGLIMVAGLSSILVLPRMEDPVLAKRAANVNTLFPGADAERVESLITEKIEDELTEIKEIKEIRSVSRVGVSTIAIELRDDIYDVDPVWSRVRDRLGDVSPELPVGASEPDFDQLEIKAYATIIALTWDRDDAPNYAILRRLAEDLEDRIRAVNGTEQVDTYGAPNEEIAVEFNHRQLTSLGLTAMQVATQIESSDAKISAGQLRGSKYDMVVEVDEELDSVARIGRTPIRLGDDGQFARLSDVATIRRGISDPQQSISIVDGKPSIVLAVLVRPDYRIDLWNERVQETLSDFAGTLPRGVESQTIFEQNNYVADRLKSLLISLVLGGTAVVFVILLMMGWRSALIVGSALPLTSLMVLTGLRILEIPIHQMSITGLIIALGLLIDNAIVIVDEVTESLRRGMKSIDAVASSVKHLAIPLFGSTLTTALAFAPIAIMPGPAGEFVGSIAVSVILAIFSSFLLAMTITPALAAIADRGRLSKANATAHRIESPKRHSILSDGIRSPRLSRAYRQSLDTVFARPWLGVLIGMALPVLGFIVAANLPEQFFPPADRNQVQIELELAPQASINETRNQALAIRAMLLEEERVKNVHWFVGESAPSFYYNIIPRRKATPRFAQALVVLDSPDDLRSFIQRMQTRLDKAVPEARVLVRQLEQGPPFDAPIEVRLFGSDLDQLEDHGGRIRQVVAGTPGIVHSRSELLERSPKLAFSIDEEKARLAQLNHAEIARQLESTLEGALGGSVIEATEEIPIRVRVSEEERGELDRIQSFDLLGGVAGDRSLSARDYPGVPFSSLAKVEVKSDVAAIQHINGVRVNEIQAFIPAGVLPSNVLGEFQERLAESGVEDQLPPGFTIAYGGEAAKRDDAVGNLMASVGVLFVLMIATLVLSFGSFRIAGLILFVAALAVGLGRGALWLFDFPFGFMAIVGTMGLIGIAINDSIVVLAALRARPTAARGDRIAVREVVERATRHVISTSLTTMAGFTPLVLAGGGFWPPLAISIAGGVMGATILALYFVPSVYMIMMCPRCPQPEAMEEVPPMNEQAQRVEPLAVTS